MSSITPKNSMHTNIVEKAHKSIRENMKHHRAEHHDIEAFLPRTDRNEDAQLYHLYRNFIRQASIRTSDDTGSERSTEDESSSENLNNKVISTSTKI
eukprot:UN25713